MCRYLFLLIRPLPLPTPFPTRRSSDLCSGLDSLSAKLTGPEKSRLLYSHLSRSRCSAWGTEDRWIMGKRERVPSTIDRKSTRLNSSHQIISYAVFCLKKKKRKSFFAHS